MLNLIFLVGMVIFALSSAYFYFVDKNKNSFNPAFLVSFITLISYALMRQGQIVTVTEAGQPIFFTRWPFYILSCTLLMVEIGRLKGIQGGNLVQLLYLTAIVMFTGFLAARDLTAFKWVFFIISSIAYALIVLKVLSAKAAASQWVNSYVFFGWTVFPVVFFLAPTGLALIGTAVAELLYLVLDIYTKIVFSIQLARKSASTQPA
jgi:sensory rhodopsin